MNAAKPAAWFEALTAANPKVFTQGLIGAAHRVLHAAGVPFAISVMGDRTQPETVRLAAQIVWRAGNVRTFIANNRAADAAAETARLFGAVVRALEIDAAPYIKAGKMTRAARSKGTAKVKATTDAKAALIPPLWDEVGAAHWNAKHDERCERVAVLAVARHPETFPKKPSIRTIRNLLARAGRR